MPIATLTIVDDFHGEYEDSILFPSAKNRTVSGRLGGDPLMRDTIELLSYWVAKKSLSSIARDLAGRERVSAVIAMQHAIASEDAERFAIQFYRRIGSEARVDDAVSWARRELGEISSRGRQVWDDPCFGTPVIYVCRDGVFFPRRRRARNEVDPAGPQGHRAAPYTSGLSGPPPMPGRRPGVGNPRDAGRSARGDAHSPGAEPDVYGED